jgi:hypothetical protein
MVALMKYANGLRFTGLVFENKETAEKWLKTEHKNPEVFELVPVAYYTANGEIL